MRKKKVIINILATLMQQFVSILCGFVVPQTIIKAYGSNINGTISSISQFLGYITLLEAGIGGVIKAAMYKPLADDNHVELSGIINATSDFFRKIAYIFLGYVTILSITYPLVNDTYGFGDTFLLVWILSFSTMLTYYYGITNQLLLTADQKMWIVSTMNTITTIINAIVTVLLVKFGFSIMVVKLSTALVFALRPLVYSIYVKNRYKLDKKIPANKVAIKQRWDGFGHHIAYFVHTNTDIAVLTLFCKKVSLISVYSIYLLIVNSVRNIINILSNGISATIGNVYAKNEKELLNEVVDLYELVNMMLISIFFGTTAYIIVPFVSLYTANIFDENYIRPLFGTLLILAEAFYCLRNPYSDLIFVAGHFKQTKNGAYFEAIINILLSVVLVIKYNIIGVAIGTMVAMLIRTLQYVYYLSNNIINRPVTKFLKRITINLVAVFIYVFACKRISMDINSYTQWFFGAFIYFLVISMIVLMTNYLLDKKMFWKLLHYFVKRRT